MESETQLIVSFFFGAIGTGFFIYGKKQRRIVPLLAGVGLCVFPYFVTNPYLLPIIGAALILLPKFVHE